MGMGSLATIGVQRPANLAIVVFDNQRYGETGMQPSHTDARRRSGRASRKSCGIKQTIGVPAIRPGWRSSPACSASLTARRLFARVRIKPEDPPRVLPSQGRRGAQDSVPPGRGGGRVGQRFACLSLPLGPPGECAKKPPKRRHFGLAGQAEIEPL